MALICPKQKEIPFGVLHGTLLPIEWRTKDSAPLRRRQVIIKNLWLSNLRCRLIQKLT